MNRTQQKFLLNRADTARRVKERDIRHKTRPDSREVKEIKKRIAQLLKPVKREERKHALQSAADLAKLQTLYDDARKAILFGEPEEAFSCIVKLERFKG